MDVSESGAIKSNGNSNSGDPGKKIKRKRKSRSAKQIERARKYRERNSYHIDARDIIMTDPTHTSVCHTNSEFGQHRYIEPMDPPLQLAGLYLSGATESHPPGYFLCTEMLPNVPWNMSNIGTTIQEPVSKVFVPTSISMPNITTIVQDQVSNLRATAKVFVPASAKEAESTFESNDDNNIEKVKDITVEIDKTRDGINIDVDETNKLLKTIDTPEQHLTAVHIDNAIPESNNTSKDNAATKDEDKMLSDSNIEESIMTENNDTTNSDNILEKSVFPENSIVENDESDMFSILQVFASSSLHCALNTATKSVITCTDEIDFGYAYFDMSNLLK